MLYRAKELSRRWNFGSTESHFIRIVEKPEVREQWTPFYSLGMVTPLERPVTTGVPWDSEFFFLLHLLQPLLINLVLILQFLLLCTHIPRETSLRPFSSAPHYHLDSKTLKNLCIQALLQITRVLVDIIYQYYTRQALKNKGNDVWTDRGTHLRRKMGGPFRFLSQIVFLICRW